MTKKEFIEKVQGQVSQAEMGKALETLVNFLDADPKYRRLENIALKTQALYNKTLQEEERGILSFEQAKLNNNIVTDTVLQLLDDVEKDNLSPSRYDVEKDQTNRWQLIVSLLTLLVIVGGVGFWIYKNQTKPNRNNIITTNSTTAPPTPKKVCPEFNPKSKFNIMLFPFDNLDGGEDRPHVRILNGITQKIVEYKLSNQADVKTNLSKLEDGESINFLSVEDFGKRCKAKLCMWGTVEQVPDGKAVTAYYRLIDKTKLDLTKLQIDENSENVETVEAITNIKPEGQLTQDVELIIKAFFGLLSHELGDTKRAIENLMPVVDAMDPKNPKDTTNFLVFSNILAEDQIKENQMDEAILTYDKLLTAHPDYQLANINQATLLYQKNRYPESIEYLNTAIEKDPQNEKLWQLRGDAYMKNKQYDKAKTNYEQVKVIKPANSNTKAIDKRLNHVNQQIRISNRVATDAQVANLTATNSNVAELTNTAEASRSIGNYRIATNLANKIILVQPNSFEAHKIKIEAALKKGDKEKARELFNKAIEAGVDKEKLYEAFPTLKPPKFYRIDPNLIRVKPNN